VETVGLGDGDALGDGAGEGDLDDEGVRRGEGRGNSWSSSSSCIGEDLTRLVKSPLERSEELDVDEIDVKDASCEDVD
jgi:hypothetical protein